MKPKPKPPAMRPKKPTAPKPKPPAMRPVKPKKPRKPKKHLPPWQREGIVQEYPEPEDWFPELDAYGYDELLDEWGGYDSEDTDS